MVQAALQTRRRAWMVRTVVSRLSHCQVAPRQDLHAQAPHRSRASYRASSHPVPSRVAHERPARCRARSLARSLARCHIDRPPSYRPPAVAPDRSLSRRSLAVAPVRPLSDVAPERSGIGEMATTRVVPLPSRPSVRCRVDRPLSRSLACCRCRARADHPLTRWTGALSRAAVDRCCRLYLSARCGGARWCSEQSSLSPGCNR